MTDPTSRALHLLGLMQARAVWSGPELARQLGVTTRTVRRDVERLRALGYTVESDAGADGGYSLGRGQVLPQDGVLTHVVVNAPFRPCAGAEQRRVAGDQT